jgi:hypothetical protein
MVSFIKLIPPALFSLLYKPTTSETPAFKPTTHHTHYIGADKSVELDAFHPEPIFEASCYLFVS